MKEKHTVFTYGTLMKGFYGYEKYMRNAKFISRGVMNGKMYHTPSNYPAVVYKPMSPCDVHGEIYHVDETTMENLRKYEGIGSVITCYEEKIVEVKTENGKILAHAFVVTPLKKLMVKSLSKKIKHGDWRKFINEGIDKKPSIGLILFFLIFSFVLFEIMYRISNIGTK